MPLPVSYLLVPGDRPDRFVKALGSGADRVILGLAGALPRVDSIKTDVKNGARLRKDAEAACRILVCVGESHA